MKIINVQSFRLTTFSILFAATTLISAGENIYTTISKAFPLASPLVIITLGSLIIIILGLIVAWEIFKSDKKKREKVKLSWQNFGQIVSEKGLTGEETAILKELIIAGDQSQAEVIFNAPFIYEKCLDSFIQKLKNKNHPKSIPYEKLYTIRKKLGYGILPVETHISSTRQLSPQLYVNLEKAKGDLSIVAIVKNVDEKNWTLGTKIDSFSGIYAGDKINIWFIRPGDGEYKLQVEVSETHGNEILLDHTLKMTRKQLRNWVRVDVNIPCKAVVDKLADDSKNTQLSDTLKRGMVMNGRIMDMSGGGICLQLATGLPSKSILFLNFDLPGSSLNNVKSEVINFSLPKKQNEDKYIHRLKFSEIETSLQEKIVRFVFEKNRMDSQFRQ